MRSKYRIRQAKPEDKTKIKQLFIQSVLNDKKLLNPENIAPSFINEFVDKVIEQGNMIVVENNNQELELIGEVHYYNTQVTKTEKYLKEINFLSRLEVDNNERETELIEWLYGEIEQNHKDVFIVAISTPVQSITTISHYLQKGIKIGEKYHSRIKNQHQGQRTVLPLSWLNPSFN